MDFRVEKIKELLPKKKKLLYEGMKPKTILQKKKIYLVWEGLERETRTIDRYRPVATPQSP